jgi:hypothetical protein
MRDHRKLRAFELADALVLSIYSVTKLFPKEEQFGLTSQLRRAGVSIASNMPRQADETAKVLAGLLRSLRSETDPLKTSKPQASSLSP